jgi:hypothetical protein
VTRGQLLSRINVLVVEGHAHSREFLDAVLTHHGAAVRYVRVVALTASAGRPLRADFDAILIRPCPVDKLCQVILRLTTGNERGIGQA